MNISIKKFSELTVEELYNILKIRNEVFVVEQQCVYQDCDGKDQESYHLVAMDNERVIGYLRIPNKNVSYMEVSIGRVLVTADVRGKGIAKDIMANAIDFIINELKENKIRISAQSYLEEFYESLGFIKVSKEYLEDGIPHIEMLLKRQKIN
ncbi:GNAT family N-acetyltransferase [Clostridiisalibacter paucivorans]|uniref:GNAT family N-acetyltransferase n=1 Tax=Clostridiisalibacter paucivorans TaxID=408753 RepID=UPI0004794303|nr:GNAT family N-acetyltransferase [Clostridiisalibacter paucivorans]